MEEKSFTDQDSIDTAPSESRKSLVEATSRKSASSRASLKMQSKLKSGVKKIVKQAEETKGP